MRIAVIGANGQLGTDVIRALSRVPGVTSMPLTHRDIEVADAASVSAALEPLRPDVVINTSAWHPGDSDDSTRRFFDVNATGALYVALACKELGADLIWFSTDYVFSGASDRPYTEEDVPSPISLYGVSKLAGEMLVRQRWPRHYIIRVAGLYGCAGCRAKGGSNVVERFLQLGREQPQPLFNGDQYSSTTYTVDVAERLAPLLASKRYGTYHMVNGGSLSWFEFAKDLFALAGLASVPAARSMDSVAMPYRRPRYTVLDGEKLSSIGVPAMPDVRDALGRYIHERAGLGSLVQGRET